MASPPPWNCLHRVPSQEGGQEWPETESWLAPNSFRHSWPSLGGSKDQQPLRLCLCSSFSLPGLSPCFRFLPPSSLSLSLIHFLALLLLLSFSHQPQFPPPFILPLKRISCFLILSSSSELRITLGSPLLPLPSPPPSPPAVSLSLPFSTSSFLLLPA